MEENIYDELLRNLSQKNDLSGAILVDGAWGSGKTYFLRQRLIPQVEAYDRTVIYVSLNGLENIAQVKSLAIRNYLLSLGRKGTLSFEGEVWQIIKGIFLLLIMWFGKLKSLVTAPAATYLLKSALKQIDVFDYFQKDTVLVFDDLERFCEVEKFLGLVANLIEKNNIKVLVVANLSNLDSFDFGKLEKPFAKTIRFSTDISMVFDRLSSGLKNEKSRDYIFTNKEVVLKIFSESKHLNFRTMLKLFEKINRLVIQEILLESDYLEFLCRFVILKARIAYLPEKHEGFLFSAKEKFSGVGFSEEIKNDKVKFAQYEYFNTFSIDSNFFSVSIFKYVVTDILIRELVSGELSSSDDQGKLASIRKIIGGGHWILKTQEELVTVYTDLIRELKLIDEIEPGILIDTYVNAMSMSEKLKLNKIELKDAFLLSIRNSTKIENSDYPIRMFEHYSEEKRQLALELSKEINLKIDEHISEDITNKLAVAIESKKIGFIYTLQNVKLDIIKKIFLADSLHLKIETAFHSDLVVYFEFYRISSDAFRGIDIYEAQLKPYFLDRVKNFSLLYTNDLARVEFFKIVTNFYN